MGWTHYWQRRMELPPKEFSKGVADCSALLGKLGIPLAGPPGADEPVFRDDEVIFNGAPPLQCEVFEIHRVEFDKRGTTIVRSYCKTEHLPYDLAVQCALVIFRCSLGSLLRVASDASEEDWERARSECQKHLGYGGNFRLDPG